MKDQLQNNSLQPPEPHSEKGYEEEEQFKAFVRKHYTISEIFDTYNHDREVVIAFETWKRTASRNLPNWEGWGKTPEILWELYCNQPKQ